MIDIKSNKNKNSILEEPLDNNFHLKININFLFSIKKYNINKNLSMSPTMEDILDEDFSFVI